MAKFLDLNGLETFLAKVKDWVNTLVNSTKSSLQSSINNKVDKTTTVNGHPLNGNVTVTKSDVSLGNVTNDAQVKRSEMGVASGVATLGSDGKLTSAQLPAFKSVNGTSVVGSGTITIDLTLYKVVEELPKSGIDSTKIYLVKSADSEESNTYTEYMYVNSAWEKLGEHKSDVDLTPYVKFTDVATSSKAGAMSSTDKAKLDGIASGANNYTHPTSSGNKHIPAGGSSGQILRWASDGTATWGNDNNTTYSAFKGATSSAAGGSGLVPAPAKGDNSSKYLKADGTWQTPPNTTYSNATSSTSGLMSSTDKAKLDGIASGANKTTVDNALSGSSTNPVQNKVINSALAGKANSSHKHTASDITSGLATVATSGNYNDLSNKPAAYSLPTASNTTKGGILIGFTESGKNYPVELDSTSKAFVNVPWTDTTYSNATSSTDGLMSSSDKSKLDGIASGANKTIVDTALSSTSTNPVQNKVINSALAGKAASSHNHDSSYVASVSVSGNNLVVNKNETNTNITVPYATNAENASTASSAAKLTTARQINGTNFDGSANITTTKWGNKRKITFNNFAEASVSLDGSGDVTCNWVPYNFKINVGNTNNYPYHRIATTGTVTGSYQDKEITLLLSQSYYNGYQGVIRLALRTNNSDSVSYVEANWLYRKGFAVDDIQVGFFNIFGNTYADAFLKTRGDYASTTGVVLTQGTRGGLSAAWTLIDSDEKDNTTTSDDKNSTECFKSIADAGTALHDQAYSTIVTAKDGSTVSAANQLVTSRTINGTSFNGSSNITTANWGTSRTLTIGNSGKSVNGSGNVSWSLSEIGAATSTHSHNAFGGATSSAAGSAGFVPAPAAGNQSKYLRGDGTWATPPNTVYTHPTSPGNKHIPSGGSSGQILRWSADGTAVWGNDNNTTYSAGTGLSLSGTTFNLDQATSSERGGIRIGFPKNEENKNYPVALNENGQAYVNVPWKDTTYSLSGLGGVGTVNASGSNGLTLSASKSGTTVTVSGSVNLRNSTAASNSSTYTAGGSSKFYSVQRDKDGYLGVYVPWTDTNTVYSLPLAASGTRGGIQIGYTSTTNNRAVQLSSEKAYVNIPTATSSTTGLMSSSDKSKLDGIATGATSVSVSRSLTTGTRLATISVTSANGIKNDYLIYGPVADTAIPTSVINALS